MTHLFLSQSSLILVSKLDASLQLAFSLPSLISPPPQHSALLQLIIILALIMGKPIEVNDANASAKKDVQEPGLSV